MTGRLGALRRRTFRSLGERNYRVYLFGHSASIMGTWMQRIGQDWLVLELTDSALALGISLVCQFLPVLLGGVWGGVVVDRVDTRRLLMVTQAVQALLAVTLAVLTLTGTVTLLAVYALAVGLGIVTVFDNPGRQTFVAELVDEPDILNAQSLNSMVNNIGRLGGPALAGVLIVTTSIGITFVVNAVSFVAVLISLLLMNQAQLRSSPVTARGPGQVREGLRYVWHQPELRSVLVLVAIVSVFAQNFRVVFPILATDAYDGDATTYGWLTAALGVGAVVGALVSAAATSSTSWRLLWVCMVFAATNLAVAAAPGLALALVVIAGLGLLNLLFNILARAIMLLNTPTGMRGRVMAIFAMVALGSTPIGGLLIGALVEIWGARVGGMVVGGAACLVGCALTWPGLRRLRATSGSALAAVPVADERTA